MHIKIERQNDNFLLKATNETGKSVLLDASESIGGGGQEFRPMQMLLIGLGSCASMDLISILKKQKQTIKSYSVEIEGLRQADAVPALFEKIHVTFHIQGKVDEEKLKKAISLSMDKYCSVAKTLEKTAEITSSYTLLDA
jgi:putative redox protein